MGAITVENVSKVFTSGNEERVMALREVSLEIKEGEFVVLLGPSGCGKTTLLRIIGQRGNISRRSNRIAGNEPWSHTFHHSS